MPHPGEFAVQQEMDIQAATLLGAWVNFGTYAPAGFYKEPNGIVHLVGLIKSGVIISDAFTLPVGMRPAQREIFIVASNGGAGTVDVNTTGAVTIASGSNVYVSLSGISFRAA